MKDEALRLALEALKHGGCPPDCKDGMTDSGGVHPWGEAALIPCPNCKAITAIKQALEQEKALQALHNENERLGLYKDAYGQPEPVAWRNAALRVGEDLCSVGPFGYYDMTAEQWLDWALSVVTVYAPTPKREWQGLTDDEIDQGLVRTNYAMQTAGAWRDGVHWAQMKLKEKNNG